MTELILEKFKNNKEEALVKLMYALEDKHKLTREFWLNFDSFKNLNSELYCFSVIKKWFDYESWEDYESTLSFNLEIVIEQLTNKLKFTDLAFSLLQAKEIKSKNDTNEHENYYNLQRPLIINSLYELAKNNIDKFP